MTHPVNGKRPAGIADEIDMNTYGSVLDVLSQACDRFAGKPAFTNMGHTLTYAEVDQLSRDFAAYLQQKTDLEPGDRIAIQLPNTLMFPVAVFGAMRAGLVVVNTNPLYSEREMEHQFNDSGARAIVVLANMAQQVEHVLPHTSLKYVFVTELGDLHPPIKRFLINKIVRYVKKLVPAYQLPQAISFRQALSQGGLSEWTAPQPKPDDVAVLQYTGGTTGVAKGAMLTHANLVANMLQAREVIQSVLGEGCETVVAPLPMYHVYTFTVNCMFLMETGNHSLLITNPRDIPAFVKELKKYRFTGFVGLNTLFVALCHNEAFKQLDFSDLKLTISGGMALTQQAAQLWEETTGCAVAEGYGMTETSPIVTFNPPGAAQLGTIGQPVPSTEVQVVDENGAPVPQGEPGELCVRGPQVMKGYWNRPDDTSAMINAEGWLRTGDIAVIQDDGYIRIVDRKKDMINVSGFNVYPNEIEDVIVTHPDVYEVAAVGVADERSGEAVKVFIVSRNPDLTVDEVRRFCKERLTAYKVPRLVEFRDELPKSNVGKVLRRQLRDEATENA
ncbi:long-chain fatty acid--CoA ligase [Terasakiispira papahanaumokuakeensis]|uniref:Long-chain-fatty-acid--CoA ligase n=1 Tax=Terasakiispira papahanaumokuakeensis TaxID=197479 RepID=A0A1E2V838_9GAMM|nr:AMP-binding protein [Terasakiispira papahanaumokuakeensis]ODC03083.1 long-chain fatty acid--CoA ligase [Terasakiispira papahanaumokuakeensis]